MQNSKIWELVILLRSDNVFEDDIKTHLGINYITYMTWCKEEANGNTQTPGLPGFKLLH